MDPQFLLPAASRHRGSDIADGGFRIRIRRDSSLVNDATVAHREPPNGGQLYAAVSGWSAPVSDLLGRIVSWQH